jgi:hypothetical protein
VLDTLFPEIRRPSVDGRLLRDRVDLLFSPAQPSLDVAVAISDASGAQSDKLRSCSISAVTE